MKTFWQIATGAVLVLLAGACQSSEAPPASAPAPAPAPASAAATTKTQTQTVVVPIEGMSCGACAGRVRRAVTALPGVSSVEVNLVERNARVRYADGQVTPEQIATAIRELGYTTGSPKEAP